MGRLDDQWMVDETLLWNGMCYADLYGQLFLPFFFSFWFYNKKNIQLLALKTTGREAMVVLVIEENLEALQVA